MLKTMKIKNKMENKKKHKSIPLIKKQNNNNYNNKIILYENNE